MSYNIEDIEKKLDNISKQLKNDKLKDIDYYIANQKYKEYISKYSKSYIEMSDFYYGDNLPYDIYCKEFNKKDDRDHYLSSKKDVIELYKLFIFYGMLEYSLKMIS